jgi:Tol biopolymer transport system component
MVRPMGPQWLASLALAAAVVAGACGGPGAESRRYGESSTQTTPSTTAVAESGERHGLLAFAANGDIYVVKPSGGGLRRVTHGPDEDFSPSWFPDGRQVAFRRSPAGDPERGTNIYQARIDGTEIRKASLPQDAEDLTWSPDGSTIAYSGGLPGDDYSKGDILVVDADGSSPRGVAGWTDSTDEFLSWSPDGEEIVFASNHGLPSDEVRTLWVTSLAHSRTRPLTRLKETPYYSTDVHPSWSPDGRTIVFQSNRGAGDSLGVAIWLIDRDGKNLRRLVHGSGEFPSWSPDGARIAFGRTGGITIVDRRGLGARTIATGVGYTGFPVWSTR